MKQMTETSDIVTRLRVLNHHAKKLAENESLHDLHRDAFTRCEDLTWEAADEIERLRGHVHDLENRIKTASILMVDWDGYYDPDTKKGNALQLAVLIEDSFHALQGRSWRDGTTAERNGDVEGQLLLWDGEN